MIITHVINRFVTDVTAVDEEWCGKQGKFPSETIIYN